MRSQIFFSLRRWSTLTGAVALVACTDASAGTPRLPESVREPTSLRAVVVQKGDVVDASSHLLVLDSSLVLVGSSPDAYVLEGLTGVTLSRFGGDQKRPGQLREGTSIQSDRDHPNGFWVFDADLKRVTQFTLSVDRRASPAVTRAVDLDADVVLFRSLWINDSTLISTGIFKEGRFGVFSRAGQFLRAMGEAPRDPRQPDSPIEVRQHAFEGPITIAPNGSRVALGTRQADRLEIRDPNGSLIQQVHGSSGFDPNYEVRRLKGVPYMTTGEDLRFGFIDLASTNQYIYALYSGRAREEAPGDANYGQYVQVFDWSGNLIETFQLDGSAIAIAPDASNEQLFALRRRPDSALVRYTLRFRARSPATNQPKVK